VSNLPQAVSSNNDDRADLEALPQRRNDDYEFQEVSSQYRPESSKTHDTWYFQSSEPRYRPMAHFARVNADSFRSLFPFFLIVTVVLLLVWRLVVSPGLSTSTKLCPQGTSSHWIRPGETCWELSREYGWTLEEFKEANPKVVCNSLMPGTSVCLPPRPMPKRLWTLFFQTRSLAPNKSAGGNLILNHKIVLSSISPY